MIILADSQSYNWITDPAWIGVILGVISVIVGFVVPYWIDRRARSKMISYQIVADTSVINIQQDSNKGKIESVYKDIVGGSEIKLATPSVLNLKVRNMGNNDVKIWKLGDAEVQDLEVPIKFSFGGRTVVALLGQVTTSPPTGVIEPEDLKAYLNSYRAAV